MNRKRCFAMGVTLVVSACWLCTRALGQGTVRIRVPQPNQKLRGEVECLFDKSFPDQGYLIIRLDDEFKEATAESRYLLNTRRLKDGPHKLTVDIRDDRGRPAGVVEVPFTVANDSADTTSPGVQLMHWDLSHYMPTRRLLRFRVYAIAEGQAVEIAPPQQQQGGGAGGEGGGGGEGGFPGGQGGGGARGPRGGGASASRLGEPGSRLSGFRSPYFGRGLGGPGGPGGPGESGGPSSGGGFGGPGGGAGGSGGNGPVDASGLDRQLSILIRSEIREIKPSILNGKVGDAADIRVNVAAAFDQFRQQQQSQTAAPGAKGPWGGWQPNTELENQSFTKVIFPSGEEIRPTGRQWFMNPYGKAPSAALIDLMPRFPEVPVQPGSRWTTSMVFIPELINMVPIELNNAAMAFTSMVDIDGRKCAKLECELNLPPAIARQLALTIEPMVGSASGGGGGEGGGPGVGGASGSRLGEPGSGAGTRFQTRSNFQFGIGSFGGVGGMMGSLGGMSAGGAAGARGRAAGSLGGSSGGQGGAGGGGFSGGGRSGGRSGGGGGGGGGGTGPSRPGALFGGGGSGGGSGGGGGRWAVIPESNGQWLELIDDGGEQEGGGQDQQSLLANIASNVKRTIYFDTAGKSVYRIEDVIHTEFDIINTSQQSGGEGGGGLLGSLGGALGSLLGNLGSAMGGGEGGSGPITRSGGGGPGGESNPTIPTGGSNDVARTHVAYQVRVVAGQDTSPVPMQLWDDRGLTVDGRSFRRNNTAHDFDSVKGLSDRAVSPSDPKHPDNRVFSPEPKPEPKPAAKPASTSRAANGKAQPASSRGGRRSSRP